MMPDELQQPKSSTATTRLPLNGNHHLPNLTFRLRKRDDREIWEESLDATFLNLYCGTQIRTVAGCAQATEREESLVAEGRFEQATSGL
jgi:hypothetical protein